MKGRKRVTPELAYHQQQHVLSIITCSISSRKEGRHRDAL
jgi:hypothetical protein